MMPRKKLEGALAEWHPHPKSANSSLIPVVRDAGAADDIADRFFDSTPQGYTPEPPHTAEVEIAGTTPRRAAIHSPAARERRRYLTRYVAGAVGLAAVIGLGAVVRITTAGDASAAQSPLRAPWSSSAAETIAEPLPAPTSDPNPTPSEPASPEPAAAAPAPAPEPASGATPAANAEERAAPSTAADTSGTFVATTTDPDGATDAKRAAQRALDRGHLKASIEAGERSVALDPTDGDAWLILGAAYEAKGAYAEARRCFKSCSTLAKRGARSECRALLR
jgi:hypothetical protein